LADQNLALKDPYQRITDRIIQDLEKGELTWRKPWATDPTGLVQMPRRWNHLPYSGINVVMLWASAAEYGFSSPFWMTYKQAKDLNAQVRKGEKASMVVYANKMEVEDKGTSKENPTTKKVSFLKLYNVFNAEQIEGLESSYYPSTTPIEINSDQRNPSIEAFFAATKAEILHRGQLAAYSPSRDVINMPPFETFENAIAYYGTLAHELTHWTGHEKRLNRGLNDQGRWKEGYAKEELVAELGACFLSSDLQIAPDWREHHSAYIGEWLNVLRQDKRFIVLAASFAQKAVDYLHGFQNGGINGLRNAPIEPTLSPV